jgi:hypothetical protein
MKNAGSSGRALLLGAIAAAGCDSATRPTPIQPTPAPFVLTRPAAVAPAGGATVRQNQPETGCPFRPGIGYGILTTLVWAPSQSSRGIAGYEVYAHNVTAANPVVDQFVEGASTTFARASCATYVVDRNLEGWQWRVRARDVDGNLSDWSEVASFRYEPCRVDGRFCG